MKFRTGRNLRNEEPSQRILNLNPGNAGIGAEHALETAKSGFIQASSYNLILLPAFRELTTASTRTRPL